MLSTGYVTCAHEHCMMIFIGNPGDLCQDCREQDPGCDSTFCNECDHD